MKKILLKNPDEAQQILRKYGWNKYSITVKNGENEIKLLDIDSYLEASEGEELILKFGTTCNIPLQNYPEQIELELEELNELGVLLRLNGKELFIRVYRTAPESELEKINNYSDLEIIDFGSSKNEALGNLNCISNCNSVHTLILDNCPNLSDISLLLNFKQLRTLFLDGFTDASQFHYISACEGLENLSQNNSDLKSLAHLEKLVNIIGLYIYGNRNLVDISPLSGLINLTNLNLRHCTNVSDISPLSGLTNLTNLNLSSCKNLSNISLSGLINLTNLDLSRCENLSDISLSGLTNLTNLNLSGCENLSDISLSGLTNLTNLKLRSCKNLSDISPLSGLTNLTNLILSNYFLNDISPLSRLTNLTDLELSSYNLSDISPLSGLTNLTNLNLSLSNYILSDISPLSGLINLTNLSLSNYILSDISSLSGLTNLTNLNLNFCENLCDISPLSGLTNLTNLDLSWCENLSDISPLSGLTNLTNLKLSYCKNHSDISPLSGLTRLTNLDLSGCSKLSDISLLSGLTNLTNLDLERCKNITRIATISNLPKLGELNLKDSPNIRDFKQLANLPNLKKLEWIDPVACSEILMQCILRRGDKEEVQAKLKQWTTEIKLSKDAVSFALKLLNCVKILEDTERKNALLQIAKPLRLRGLESDNRNDLESSSWEYYCELALELKADDAITCLEAAVTELDIKRETELLLGPVIVACAELTDLHPGEKEKMLNRVKELLQQLEGHQQEELQVAPSAAVFFATLNMKAEVLFWLDKATDEKAPLWREKVLQALIKYYSKQENFEAARECLDKMKIEEEKDRAIAMIAEAMAAKYPIAAGFLLDEIREEAISVAAARRMLQLPSMFENAQSIYQLLLHLQENSVELAACLETMIEKDKEGKVAAALSELFLSKKAAEATATVFLELAQHDALFDFVRPRDLEKYRKKLIERKEMELNDSKEAFVNDLVNENLITAEDFTELLEKLKV